MTGCNSETAPGVVLIDSDTANLEDLRNGLAPGFVIGLSSDSLTQIDAVPAANGITARSSSNSSPIFRNWPAA